MDCRNVQVCTMCYDLTAMAGGDDAYMQRKMICDVPLSLLQSEAFLEPAWEE